MVRCSVEFLLSHFFGVAGIAEWESDLSCLCVDGDDVGSGDGMATVAAIAEAVGCFPGGGWAFFVEFFVVALAALAAALFGYVVVKGSVAV